MPTLILRPVATVWTRLLSFVMSLALVLFAVAPVLATSIQTDLWVYAQGDTVNVTGDGFGASEDVEIVTTDPYAVEVDRGTVTSDELGNIAYSFVLISDVPGIYDIVATGLTSGLTAATQFDPAEATVTPSSQNYGSVAVGSTSAQVFNLENTGNTVMNAISVVISGADSSQFVLNTSGTASTLAAGESTTFTITFTPTSTGAKSASATVQSNANPDPVIPLSGVGTAADGTPPNITKTVTGTLGSNGWYTSNVTVDWSVTDPESSFTVIGCDDVTYSAETMGTTSSCSATSAGGTSSDSVTIKLDKTGPSAALAVTAGTAGTNGWYTSAVTVSATGSDSISSPVTCSADQVFVSDTPGTIVNGSCTNEAGLSKNAAPITIKIDATGPTAALSVTAGTPGANGWYTSDVTVHTSGADDSSPVTCTVDQFQTAETAGTLFNGSCTNDAGLTTNAAALNVKLDKTGPSANLAVSAGTLGSNGWYTSDVTLSTTGADSISNPTVCTVDQFQTTETTGQLFSGACTNDAGLTTNATDLTVKLDKTGPTAALSVSAGTLGSNGWYTSDVTVSTTGSDTISNPTSCSADQFQTAETAGTLFNGSCTNDAGLTTNAAALNVKLDKTNPTISISHPANGGVYSESSWDAGCLTLGVGDFCGSATDPGASASGIDFMEASLFQASTGKYWDGSGFNSTPEVFYFSSVSSAWSFAYAYAGFSATSQYTVHAKTYDKAGRSGEVSAAFQLNRYTLDYLNPLDDSIAPDVITNMGKNGRVIPVKVQVFLEGVLQTNAQIPEGNLKIGVNHMASCDAGTSDTVEAYADAGASSGNSALFRWTSPQWIYNLDTKALGLATSHCYRLDVYVYNAWSAMFEKISTQRYAVFQPTK